MTWFSSKHDLQQQEAQSRGTCPVLFAHFGWPAWTARVTCPLSSFSLWLGGLCPEQSWCVLLSEKAVLGLVNYVGPWTSLPFKRDTAASWGARYRSLTYHSPCLSCRFLDRLWIIHGTFLILAWSYMLLSVGIFVDQIKCFQGLKIKPKYSSSSQIGYKKKGNPSSSKSVYTSFQENGIRWLQGNDYQLCSFLYAHKLTT